MSDAERLAAYDRMYADLLKEREKVLSDMERLRAAGKIHSDIERGFIRAETINFDEMMACGGSVAAAKEKGLLRSEGKEYVVKDGDMIYFRFNV